MNCRVVRRWWRLDQGYCPGCERPLEVSGLVFVGIGVGLWLFCSLILCYQANTLGAAVLIALSAFGVVRLVRQWYAGHRWRRGARVGQAEEEGPSCVSANSATSLRDKAR
jgi:hypothetical protein